MTQWIPTGNKILVKCDGVEEVTASGIVVVTVDKTEREKMKQMYGTVVAMGPMAYNDQGHRNEDGTVTFTPWVQVGDHVKFQQYAGWRHAEGGVEYRVLHDLDIMMVERNGDSDE